LISSKQVFPSENFSESLAGMVAAQWTEDSRYNNTRTVAKEEPNTVANCLPREGVPSLRTWLNRMAIKGIKDTARYKEKVAYFDWREYTSPKSNLPDIVSRALTIEYTPIMSQPLVWRTKAKFLRDRKR
jgi:hypothetical protein